MTQNQRQRLPFDADWRYAGGDAPNAAEVDFDDTAWRTLELPHDWSIEGPFSEAAPCGGGGGYLPGGIGWYRKHFTLPAASKGRRVTIEFDGVYKHSDVWLNGHHLGFHPYGYTGFHYDLTPFVRFGAENVLAVRVDNSAQPDSRWYTGSGIYRHVWLTTTATLHVAQWGTYVRTPLVSAAIARVEVITEVRNEAESTRVCTLVTTIVDAHGAVAAVAEQPHPVLPGQSYQFIQYVEVTQPHLWSDEDPYLYQAISRIREEEQITDETVTPFGIREAVFDVDKGLLLNGRQVKIRGVCIHHDGGCVGAAVPERVWERRLETLKEMGCNGIRSSHYPPAPSSSICATGWVSL